MVDEPVRTAIVGLGVMGRDHLKNALALQQEGVLRLVGLSDVEGERVRDAGTEHDLPVFETVEALLYGNPYVREYVPRGVEPIAQMWEDVRDGSGNGQRQ